MPNRPDPEQWYQHGNQPFVPSHEASNAANVDLRVANALEYIAYQMGEISRDLKEIKTALQTRT